MRHTPGGDGATEGHSVKITVVNLRDPSDSFANDGYIYINVLAFRDAVWPAAFYTDATYASVSIRPGGTFLTLSGASITFTQDAMSGTIDSVFVYDDQGRLLLDVRDIGGLDLGDPAWGIPAMLFSGDDEIVGSVNSDAINGYGGDDKLNGRKGADVIHGGDGDDRIAGNGGSDQLFGDAGNDTIIGGRGGDLMFGGAGKDSFRFNDTGGTGRGPDTIGDFGRGNDRILLDKDGFKGIGPLGKLDPDKFAIVNGRKTADSDDRILFDPRDSKIYYDPDGSGPKDARLIALVFGKDGSVKVTADDFFVV